MTDMPTTTEVEALQDACWQGGTVNLGPVAPLCRRINAANGWVPAWDLDQIPTRLALVHTEFREFRDALVGGEKIEADDELADIIIRCLDTVELVRPGWAERLPLPPYYSREHTAATLDGQRLWLADIRDSVDNAMEHYRKVMDEGEMAQRVAYELAWVAQRVAALLQERGADPIAVVVRVLLRSRTRGHRHGGRRV